MDTKAYILHANLETDLATRSSANSGLQEPVASHFCGSKNHAPTGFVSLHTRCCALLDASELAQAGKFRFARDSILYAAAHALLRLALSQHCPEIKPCAWRFTRGKYGKPGLLLPKPSPQGLRSLRFSLSHSWPHIAILVTCCGHCGIDIEPARTPAGFEGIAKSVFRKEEYVEMLSSPSPETHFLRLWTIREALCKALGCGFPRGFPHLYIQNGFTSFSLHRHPLSAQSLALCNSDFVLSACILTKQKEVETTIQEFDFSVFDVSRKFSEDDIQCPAKQQQIHLCSGV